MTDIKTKFDENHDFFWDNYHELKEMYPGHWVSILDKDVVYVARDDDVEYPMWSALDRVEQLDVYTTYIKGRDEHFVV